MAIARLALACGACVAALSAAGCGDGAASDVRQMTVTVTAYNSIPRQTDSTPHTSAFQEKLRPGMKVVAVSRDLERMGLTHNTRLKIEGLDGVYRVADRTNKRWTRRVDLYMGTDRKAAREWGKRRLTIEWPVEPE